MSRILFSAHEAQVCHHILEVVTSYNSEHDLTLEAKLYQVFGDEGREISAILASPRALRAFHSFKYIYKFHGEPSFRYFERWHPELQEELLYLLDVVNNATDSL